MIHGAGMVATNDMLNLDVREGRHATHPVIRRSYADEHGCSWDGPGVIAHEGYKHWYVDAEWSIASTQRGALVLALSSVVEHLHPHNAKSEHDEVYELGQKFAKLDLQTFERRAKKHWKAWAA
jgi:hypothetical protein